MHRWLKNLTNKFRMTHSISTYVQQSQRLNLYSPYELDILKNADFSIEMRRITKIVTIIGSVASAVSHVFTYDSTLPLIVTSVSAIAWFGFHKLAQKFEPQAQSMIRELQQRPTNNQENKSSIQIHSRKDFQDSKKILLGQLTSTNI